MGRKVAKKRTLRPVPTIVDLRDVAMHGVPPKYRPAVSDTLNTKNIASENQLYCLKNDRVVWSITPGKNMKVIVNTNMSATKSP